MIGNDIVNLTIVNAESNWKRKGYLNKIYSSTEQELIASSLHPDEMVWTLWSMKEASYKANNRITKIREYAPSKIFCSIHLVSENIYYGFTNYNDLKFHTRTYVCKDYIHTIALYDSECFKDVKEMIIKDYPVNYIDYVHKNNYLALSESITKDEFGVPNLYNSLTNTTRPISISHHGNLLSIVINEVKI